jgi:preprotein translocase subunit SecF
MFRVLGDTNIDFMGRRRLWAVFSLVMIAASAALLVVMGLNLGVEFQGGAEVVLQFKEPQDLGRIRGTLADAGFPSAQVTTVSQTALELTQQGIQAPAAEESGVQIKVPLSDGEGDAGDLGESIIRALRAARGGETASARPELNTMTAGGLRSVLSSTEGLTPEEADRAADAILAYRRQHCGLVEGLDTLLADPAVVQEVSERAGRALRAAVEVNPRADLNTIDRSDLACFLEERGAIAAEQADVAAAALLGFRDDHRGVIEGMEALRDNEELAAGIDPVVLTVLESEAVFGDFARRSNDFIGSAVSGEMRNQAISAIVLSLLGMFAYLWFRFKGPQWGLAAIAALSHDVAITLGAFVLFGADATLPVVAAFLTLVGYSVNDTIVVFDRIRENQRARRSQPLEAIVNESVNQCLSRTVLTSGTTWVVVWSLFLFGGAVINGFAFVLLVGVAVGTYSSIYVASPLLLFWQRFLAERKKSREASRRRSKRVAV